MIPNALKLMNLTFSLIEISLIWHSGIVFNAKVISNAALVFGQKKLFLHWEHSLKFCPSRQLTRFWNQTNICSF